jgi:hypothetical protein
MWEDNIKIDLREIVYGGMDRIHLAQYKDQQRAHVNTVMNLLVNKMLRNSLVAE